MHPSPLTLSFVSFFVSLRDQNCFQFFLWQMHQIRGCTLGNGGHAAFASIMWSPPVVSHGGPSGSGESGGKGDFYDCLKNVQCDVLLVFGKDDPWCKPSFARNMLLSLEERTALDSKHKYIEISNTGHCPNHEAPKAVGHIVNRWVGSNDRFRATPTYKPITFTEEWGDMVVQQREKEDIEISLLDKIVTRIL